jgi:hypothetical protein
MGRLRLHNGKQLKIALQQTQLINNGEFQSCNFLQEIIFAQLGCCPKKGDTNFVTASADLTNCQGQWETATNCTSKDTINHNKSRKVCLISPWGQSWERVLHKCLCKLHSLIVTLIKKMCDKNLSNCIIHVCYG